MQKNILFIFGFILSLDAMAVSVKDRLVNTLKSSNTLKGNFTQSTTGFKVQSGNFKVKRPNRFIWKYSGKNGQKIISTGKRVWIEEPDLEHAYHVGIKKALGKSPALLLLNPAKLTEEFKLHNVKKSSGLEWVELVPKDKGAAEFEKLFVGLDAKSIRQIKIIDALGRTTLIKFSRLEFDVPLSDRDFKYSPPSMFDTF